MTFSPDNNFDTAYDFELEERKARALRELDRSAQLEREAYVVDNGAFGEGQLSPEQEEEDAGFLGTVADIGKGIVGGLEDAGINTAQSLLDIGGLIDSGVNIRKTVEEAGLLIDAPETGAGAFARGTANFLTAFIPAMGALKALGASAKVSKALTVARASRVGRLATGGAARAAVAGAAADFIAIDPHMDRLSNLAEDYGFGNPLTAILAAEEGDTALEGRLKNTIEGIGLGLVAESIIQGVKFSTAFARAQAGAARARKVAPKVRQAVSDAGKEVTWYRQELAELRMIRKVWSDMGEAGGDAAVAEARIALKGGRKATTKEAQALLDMAEVRSGQSGRTPMEEFDALARPMDEASAARSSIAGIESQSPKLADTIRGQARNLEQLDARINISGRQLEESEEIWFNVTNDREWLKLTDDVRLPAEKLVDDYVPREVADEVAAMKKFNLTANCNL